MLVMPAMRPYGLATVKVVTAIGGRGAGLSSHLLVFDPRGQLLAVIEAHELTARRTAAASVFAAQLLGKGSAKHLAILGAGRQARAQLRAFTNAMPIESITLWARRHEAAEELSKTCASSAYTVRVALTPADAVRNADICTCATASERPLIEGAWLAPGTHVDLVGGFRPNMREADDALMRRAVIVADGPAALAEAGDLVQPIANGAIRREQVLLLSQLLANPSLRGQGDITVFKSVGHAAEDHVVAEVLIARLGLLDGKVDEGGAGASPLGGSEACD
jgi:ornithine cyclodeaminase